ncbi:MAG: hypothetical protein FJ279_28220 [Planctomycetes bacterium]|nr:hypothetical protein [Planctomycetota bacterium]
MCAQEATWKVQDLGVPVKAVMYGNSHAALGPSPEADYDIFYIGFYSTTGGELVGYDWRAKKRYNWRLPSSGGYGCTRGLDGSIYVGGVGPGNLYRFEPKTQKLTSLGGSQLGVTYLWDLATAPDGCIYGAGYPKSRLIRYDPATGQTSDLGTMVEGQDYLRSICVDRKGQVWCGIGTKAHLVVYDPKTGEKANVLPNEYLANQMVYELATSGDEVYASVLFSGVALVFNIETKQVVRTFRPPPGEWAMFANFNAAGQLYCYTSPSQHLLRYDPKANAATPLAEALGQVEVVLDDRYALGFSDQDWFMYDLQAARFLDRRPLTDKGDGMQIYTLCAGLDGRIYGSTYINQHIFRCDPDTGQLTDLGKVIRWGGQVDSLCAGREGKVYMGAYSYAVIAAYDPRRPWSPGLSPDSNPREYGPLGKGQYRTTAIVHGPDGRLYVGSIPSYNSAPTGAFSVCDPVSGEREVRTDFVPGGAVSALAADDRYVYGAGGGEFFILDPKPFTKAFSMKLPVSALVLDKPGRVVGCTRDEFFAFDADKREIVLKQKAVTGAVTRLARGPDGSLYGINAASVVQIAPATLESSVIVKPGGSHLACDPTGRVYFANGSRLFRASP